VRSCGFHRERGGKFGAAVVLPIALLLVGQATGVMYFSVGLTLLLGLILWVIDAALLRSSVRTFRRSALVAQL
jgi:hypothetical protein